MFFFVILLECQNQLLIIKVLQPSKVLQDEELVKGKKYPKREEFQWRPSSILCKRFDLIDPYMGKVLLFIFVTYLNTTLIKIGRAHV